MTLKAKQLLGRLEIAIGINGPPRLLKVAIEHELTQFFQVSALEAAELAEKHAPSLAAIIMKQGESSTMAGTIYPLVVIGAFSDAVAGSCYALPEDSPLISQLKTQRSQAAALFQAIQQLTFTQFEAFGARILGELGATHTKITPHANDQGIDFYGELSLGAVQGNPAAFFRFAHDVRIAFVGQAKHYPNSSIGTDVVRELVGAAGLARTKTFSTPGLDLFEGMDLKPFSPLVAMLLTTGGLTLGAVMLAKEAGIIARSGQQVAVFLSEKGVGMEATPGGPVFRPALFMDWLNSPKSKP